MFKVKGGPVTVKDCKFESKTNWPENTTQIIQTVATALENLTELFLQQPMIEIDTAKRED